MDQEQRKTHENNSSSYLSLKAELLRKKQNLQKSSSTSSSTPSSSMILDDLQSSSSSLRMKNKTELDVEVANSSKKKKKDDEEEKPSTSLTREDENVFAKSRAILEAKAKLYDEIMSNSEMKILAEEDDEDNEKTFLVDFERKIYESNAKTSKIEFTDGFGRTRLVTPDEYDKLRVSEEKLRHDEASTKRVEKDIERVERLHREKMRSKWEAEMEELRNKTHVTYQDVLFDEQREHGVGYYQFSTDDQRRAEQMATLNELRNKTKIEQSKFSHEKDQRQSAMAERLNKIRARKAKEMGIQLNGDEPSPSSVPTTEKTPPPPPQIEIVPAKPSNSPFAYPFPVKRAVKPSTDEQST